ncbi:MAG: serine/threonine-protein kinase [Gammaproteobacteria bacterium]
MNKGTNNLSEEIARRLEEIQKSSEKKSLIEKFKNDFPDKIEWLNAFSHDDAKKYQSSKNVPEINGFQIQKVIGMGANGKVFLATENQTGESFAIKIPLQLLSEDQMHRFHHESRLLSSLTHKNIAQVYQTGVIENSELPYIVMEYVEGENIFYYCQNHTLTSQQKVKLFIQILDAIQYAHNRGIVHRDIKPDNILVTKDQQVKLLDFGIATATENSTQQLTQLTKTGQIVGTLAYMSPEQVSGLDTLDTRADVYSLGVVLYQLLSGSLPFKIDANQIFSAISKIIEDLPTKITAANNSVDSELATIVHHSIEKKADNRYQSANEFKRDLLNWLNDEPISVKSNYTLWYTLRHLARKHRALFTGTILAILGLISGLVFAISFAVKEQQARKIAETNALTNQRTVDFINEIFSSADPENVYGEELTVLQLIDNAERSLEYQLQGETEVEARIRTTIAGVYAGLNQTESALKQLEKVRNLLPELKEVQNYHDFYYAVNFIEGKINLALNNTNENIELLNQLIKESENYPVDKHQAQVALANTYLQAGDVDRAQVLLEEITQAPVSEDFPLNHISRLFAQNSYALLFDKLGNYKKSKELYEKNLISHIEFYGEHHMQTLIIRNNLATVEVRMGNTQRAEEMFRKVIEGKSEILGEYHLSTMVSKANLLSVLVTSEQFELADEYSKQLLADLEQHIGELHPRTLDVKNMRAYLLEDMGQLSEAEQLYRTTLKQYSENGIVKGPELFSLQNNLAMLLMKEEKLDESKQIFAELLENIEEYLGKEHIYYAIFIGNYGELLMKLKEFKAAKPLLQKSHDKIVESFGENHQRSIKAKKRLEQLAQSE